MNKILYACIAVALVFVGYFAYAQIMAPTITNYPSKGADIIAFGDSLVYGTGASSQGANFVSLLSQKIGKPIINLGVPGNTTADGLKRINELDAYHPKIVILLLGGNDYLQKVPKVETFANLEKLILNIQSRGAVVLLLGVRGGVVKDNFADDFERIADKYHVAYVSDVLSGLFGDQRYMSDAVHPNDVGYAKISERILPVLQSIDK